MPYRSRWNIDIPQVTLPTFLFQSPTAPLSEAPSLIDAERPDTYFLSSATYRLWSQRFAVGLIVAGLKPGEPVLLYSGNTLFNPVVFLGAIMARGIFSGANPGYTAREVAYQLSNTGARFLLCADNSLDTGLAAAKEAGLPKDRVFVFDDGYATFDGKGAGRNGCQHWSALLASPEAGRAFHWKESKSMVDDTVALNYSSGTTGLPKGVMITHKNHVSNSVQHMHLIMLRRNYAAERPHMRWLCILPMYHALAQTVYAVCGPSKGIPVYIMHKFDFVTMLRYVQDLRISDLQLVPPIVIAMAKSELTKRYDLSSVFSTGAGGAPMGPEIARDFERLWPDGAVNLKQAFGMTEATCSILGWDPQNYSDSYGVGEPYPNIEVKLVDPETLEEVGRGERGELWLRGPNVMKGYWKNQKATAETLTPDGWLRSGDIAMRNDKGIFFIVDRIKELIKVKGNQVAPAELEAQLLEHPGVADTAVVGVTINNDEFPRAYVVPHPSHQATIRPVDVVKYMDEKVSRNKRLGGGVVFVGTIPKNPSGKIMRRTLKEQARIEIEGQGREARL